MKRSEAFTYDFYMQKQQNTYIEQLEKHLIKRNAPPSKPPNYTVVSDANFPFSANEKLFEPRNFCPFYRKSSLSTPFVIRQRCLAKSRLIIIRSNNVRRHNNNNIIMAIITALGFPGVSSPSIN